jgi:undecaprenyl diphosphate synthase
MAMADGQKRKAKTGSLDIFMEWKASAILSKGCAELGIEYLTLYAFSTENWDRPEDEVEGLMELLVSTIRKEVESPE